MWKILHESISNDLKIIFTSRPRTGIKLLKQLSPSYEGVLLLTTRVSMTIRSLLLAHVSGTVFLVTSTGWKNLNPLKYNSHPCSGRSLTRSRDAHPLIPTPFWNGERILQYRSYRAVKIVDDPVAERLSQQKEQKEEKRFMYCIKDNLIQMHCVVYH